MKRHICAAAGAVVLALAGAGTATASGLPIVGKPIDLQSVSLGDQTVGEQRNSADVTQAQGNGNLNVSPSIAILGDASTSNAQGNGNTALAGVGQSNEASQSQTVDQTQGTDHGSADCCGGPDSTQVVEGGDQSVGEQKNEADVTQEQGNGNVNVSPAIAILGDASTSNEQGNGNTAVAFVDQANAVDQSQDVTQTQTSSGGACCGGQSQDATQVADLGDQSVEKQKNEAVVRQSQGNGNVNVSPAIAILGGKKADSCAWSCSGHGGPAASTANAQGNGNKAVALVDQGNTVTQTQDVQQTQTLPSKSCCTHEPEPHPCAPVHCKHEPEPHPCAPVHCGHQPEPHPCAPLHCGHQPAPHPKPHCDGHSCHPAPCEHHPKHHTKHHPKDSCCDGSSQAARQRVTGGDQSVGEQRNSAAVTQEQGNGNTNRSPAIALGGGKHDSCGPCWKGKDGRRGASASTSNAQGNGNTAVAGVQQGNSATQTQSASQVQRLAAACKEVMRW